MKCPRCDFQNPEGAKFCIECGNRLAPISGALPQVLSYDDKLKRLQRYLPEGLVNRILSEKDKIEGELRHVTVMFCDMKGFTPLSARLGPAEVFTLMDQLYEILIHKVNEYEGTVNELRGDGILALFGAPIALEDAPVRALQSALAIQAEMRKFNETIRNRKQMPPILFRIGINCGPVVVGSVGNDLRVQFTALGDTINMAARMEGLAKPGTIYVTDETYKLTHPLFQFEPLGEMKIKGKPKPVPVYRLISAKDDIHRPRLGSERMIYSEMVGRDKELDRLERQVMKAMNGEGSVVNIVGEAGIGKSRLVAELKKRDVMKGVTFLEGSATSIGRNLSFHPIIDLLKHWAGIRHDDGEATAFSKLERAVRAVCPEELYDILPFVATLMGVKLSGKYAERAGDIEGEALERLIHKNVRDLLAKAAELNPLVIVIEDLHWADSTSIDLLESLYRLAETRQIVFINLFRQGHKDTGDRIASNTRTKLPGRCIEILLEALDQPMSERLVLNMLNVGVFHHPVIRRIAQRAGGNPFFVEECVRSLIDDEAIIQENGKFHVTEKIESFSIPNTIHDVLMARIDRLDEGTRNLVKIASVIGRSFFYKVISNIAEYSHDIDEKLYVLKQKQFIRERSRMGEVEYLFKHALAQEVAYGSILPQKQMELHSQVARSIEIVFAHRLHEFYGMLAYHYSKSGNLEKSEEYLTKAGEEALNSSASNEALHYYQEALGLYLKKHGETAELKKVAMLEKNIALAFYNRGQYEEAIEYFEKTLRYDSVVFPTTPIPIFFKFVSACIHLLISLYVPILKFNKMPTQKNIYLIDLLSKKCQALGIINPRRFFIESLYICKEITKFNLTHFDLGLKMFAGAAALFSFTGISFSLSKKILNAVEYAIDKNDSKNYITFELSNTLHNYFCGDWKAVTEYDKDLVDENLRIGEVYYASQHLYWHGLLSIYRGSLTTCREIIEKLEQIIDSYENSFSIILKYELKTTLLLETRNLPSALSQVEKAIDFAQECGLSLFLFDLYSFQLWINTLLEDMPEAEKSLEKAREVKSQVDAVPAMLSTFYLCEFRYFLQRLKESLKSEKTAPSSSHQRNALESGKKLLKFSRKTAQHRVEAYNLFAQFLWLNKKSKKALKWWQRAIEEGNRLDARLELSRAYMQIGLCLFESEGKQKSLYGTGTRDYIQKAEALFEEMGLWRDLEELRATCRA